MNNGTYLIAEIGSNHNGSLDRALDAITEASKCGFDAVKFQYFRVDKMYAPEVRDQFEHLRAVELPLEWLPEIASRAKREDLDLGFSVFHLGAIEELDNILNKCAPYSPNVARQAFPLIDFLKVASYEACWSALVREVLGASWWDVEAYISCGLLDDRELEREDFSAARLGGGRLVMMHCVSQYPCRNPELWRISYLQQRFGRAGYSDHSGDIQVVTQAASLGANPIEIHFDVDGKGMEAGHSWRPRDVSLVKREIEKLEERRFHPNRKEMQWRRDSDGFRPLMKHRQTLGKGVT